MSTSPFCSVKKYKELISEAEKAHTKATGKYGSREKELKDARRQLKALLKAGKVSKEQQEAAELKLSEIEASLREVDDVRPKTGSLFVRLFLGQVNVKSRFAGDRNTLRDEYEKFKGRTNYAFLTFPTIWLLVHVYLRHVWRYTHWIHILTHVWLLYYYVSLSLRENILKVNGSNIRPWWIYHHYISAVMSIIVLTWPPDRYVRSASTSSTPAGVSDLSLPSPLPSSPPQCVLGPVHPSIYCLLLVPRRRPVCTGLVPK